MLFFGQKSFGKCFTTTFLGEKISFFFVAKNKEKKVLNKMLIFLYFVRVVKMLQFLLLVVLANAQATDYFDFDSDLNVKVDPALYESGFTDFVFPAMPPFDSGAYDYAFKNAVMFLPEACVTYLGLTPNLDDGEGTGVRTLWGGRIFDLPGGNLDGAKDCNCGWAIHLAGSGGATGAARIPRMVSLLSFTTKTDISKNISRRPYEGKEIFAVFCTTVRSSGE